VFRDKLLGQVGDKNVRKIGKLQGLQGLQGLHKKMPQAIHPNFSGFTLPFKTPAKHERSELSRAVAATRRRRPATRSEATGL
jgi:hypothetical protein